MNGVCWIQASAIFKMFMAPLYGSIEEKLYKHSVCGDKDSFYNCDSFRANTSLFFYRSRGR